MMRIPDQFQPNRTTAERIAVRLLLAVASVALFMPLSKGTRSVPILDLGWELATNQAIAQGLSFGDQFVFTFGPYSSVYTQLYSPATSRLMFLGALYLALSCWVGLSTVADGRRWRWTVAFCLAAIILRAGRDAVFFLVPLLSGLAAWRLASFPSEPLPVRSVTRMIHVVALFAPLGLLPLIKGSALFLSAAIVGLCAVMFMVRDRKAFALITVASAALSMLLFWVAAGQSMGTLPIYIRRMARLSSAYTNAMALDGDAAEIYWYLAAAAVLLMTILVSRTLTRLSRVFHLCVYVAFLFVAFKAGFVRHDQHAVTAAVSLLLGALCWPVAIDAAPLFPMMLMAVFTWAYIDGHHIKSSTVMLSNALPSLYDSARIAINDRLGDQQVERRQLEASLETVRRQIALPALPGTTDIYSSGQAYLFASHNTWAPRPVFQSYAAYTPALSEMNRDHLLGAAAPDNIIFRIEPIDGRLPSSEDGPSWPLLLSRYQVTQMWRDFLFLARRPHPLATGSHLLLNRSVHAFGERIPVPRSPGIIFATIEIRPTLLGRLVNFLFKSDQLEIRLDMVEGPPKQYRLVPGLASSGFVVSPLIETTIEFGMLYGNEQRLAEKSVAAVTVQPRKGLSRHWNSQYAITLNAVTRADGEGVSSHWLRTFKDEPSFEPVTVEPCAGSFDVVNGASPAPRSFTASTLLDLKGWLAASLQKDRAPDAVYVVLTDADGRHRYAEAELVPRPDVATYFHEPALTQAGFALTADIATLKGSYTVSAGMKREGRVVTCSNLQMAGRFGVP